MIVLTKQFIYIPDEREDPGEGRNIHIVYLEQKNAILKIKDFTRDISFEHVCLVGTRLYIANSRKFFMVNIAQTEPLKDGEIRIMDVEKLGLKIWSTEIPEPLKMHGFFENSYSIQQDYAICSVELEDNQMSTQRLYFWEDVDPGEEFEFLPYREYWTRTHISNDPIMKFRQFINKTDFQFGIALRKSGRVDLYYNYSLKSETEDPYQDVEITFNHMFGLKRHPETKDLRVYKINSADSNARVSFQEAEDAGALKPRRWDTIHLDPIKHHIRLYNSMILGRRSFLVSHSNIVSIYDLIKNKWVQHMEFESKIVEILRDFEKDGSRRVFIILENGKIHMIEVNRTSVLKEWHIIEGVSFNYIGAIKQICSDFVDICFHTIKTYDSETQKYCLYYLGNSKLEKLEIQLETDDYLISFKHDDLKERKDYLSLIEQYEQPFVLYSNSNKTMRFFYGSNQIKEIKISNPAYFQTDQNSSVPEIFISTYKFIVQEDDRYLGFGAKRFGVFKPVPGTENEFSEYTNYQDLNLSNILLIDSKYVYMINNSTHSRGSSFSVQNIKEFYSQKDTESPHIFPENSFKLKYALGGKSYNLAYYRQEERISYQNDFQTVKIVPILHRNNISFFGMRPRSEYFAFKRIKDAFIGLDKNQNLTTWNAMTGKIISQIKIQEDLGLNGFSIYRESEKDNTYMMSWYQNTGILLYDATKEIPDVDRAAFFGDRYKAGINNARCNLDFEPMAFYQFKLISIVDSQTVKVHFSFMHPKYGHNYQKMYISENQQLMLERLQNHVVFLYQRKDKDLATKEVSWTIIRRVQQFSTDFADYSYFNYLFTPNLQLYLDYTTSENKYSIKYTHDQTLYMDIPTGIFSPKQDEIASLSKLFMFISNTQFKVINKDGVERYFDISDKLTPPIVLGYGRIPMFDGNMYYRKTGHTHFYMEYACEDSDSMNTKERLLRSIQYFYSEQNGLIMSAKKQSLFQVLNYIDYPSNINGKVGIDLSFTFMHWKIAEGLQQEDPKIKIELLDDDQIKMLTFNIYPQGRTILHYIADNPLYIKQLYQRIKGFSGSVPYQIPFIKNFNDESPLHICLKNQDMQAINTFLMQIKDDPIDNHGRAIIDIIPDILALEIPSFTHYLSGRLVSTSLLAKLDKGSLIAKYPDSELQLYTAQQCSDVVKLKEQALDQTEGAIQKDIKAQILDIPEVHSFVETRSSEFFNKLSKVKGLELFSNEVVKAIIDFKWPIVKEHTVKMLFLPFLIYIAAFITFSNVFNGQLTGDNDEEKSRIKKAKFGLIISLYVLSCHSILNEVIQLWRQRLEYLTSFWNLLDVIIPTFVCVVISYHLIEMQHEGYTKPNFIHTIHSLSSYLMYLKLFYFLRIFQSTGYLIRMLNTVLYDMRVFLLILIIMYFGFGEAFLRLSEASNDDSKFIVDYPHALLYAYRLSLGDMSTDTFDTSIQPVTVWLLFVVCILYTNIVMLNLLIAIISESFALINSNSEQASYQERASLIAENAYLVPEYRKEGFCQRGEYLVIIRELQEEEIEEEGPQAQDRLKEIEDKIGQLIDKIK